MIYSAKDDNSVFFFLIFISYLYFFFFFPFLMDVLAFHCCAGFSLVEANRGYSLLQSNGVFMAVSSLVVEHRL